MEEVSLLLYLNRYVKGNDFDVIILDCAPTGESIRFISIPTALEWYIKKIFKMERTLAKYVGPLAKRVYDIPIPGDDYFAAIEHLFERLQGVDRILVDPRTTSVRLVTNPEKIVLKETQRAFMYFCLYKMNIDAVIMNRLLPEDVTDEYFKTWRESQRQHFEKAEEYFHPVPIFPVSLFRSEILGYDRISDLASEIYGNKNPLEFFSTGEPYELVKENGDYVLRMNLPFVSSENVELNRISDELIIRIGAFKRHLLLPRYVAASESVKARVQDKHLCVFFKGGNHGQKA
jgi:arsenite-transporting ATPase